MDCLIVLQKERLPEGGTGEDNKPKPGHSKCALNRGSIGKKQYALEGPVWKKMPKTSQMSRNLENSIRVKIAF